MNMEAGKYASGLASEQRQRKFSESMKQLDEHPLVERYQQPEILGEGGGRIVLTVARFPDHVVKVQREILISALSARSDRDSVGDREKVTKRTHLLLRRILRQERGSAETFRKYFGDAALREKIGIMNVPVTAELLDTVKKDDTILPALSSGIHEVETVVTLQDRAPQEAFGKGTYGMKSEYVELQEGLGLAEYERMNRLFLDNEAGVPGTRGMELLAEAAPDGIAMLLAQSRLDPELHTVLQEFVTTAIHFTRETGGIIDFIGKDNIRVYQDAKDDSWHMTMMDARLSGGMFVAGRSAIRKMIDHQRVTPNEAIETINAVNYVRFLNAIAQEVDVSDRLQLLDEPIAPHSETLLSYIRLHLGRPVSAEATYVEEADMAAK